MQELRERNLQQVCQAANRLFNADTEREICDRTVAEAESILSSSSLTVYLWDDSNGVLRPRAATSDTTELFGELPTISPGESLAWNVFIDGETRLFKDVRQHEQVYNQDTSIRSELMIPLGESGILLAGTTTRRTFADDEIQAVETLAANATAALERTHYEETLRDTEQRLQHHKERLDRLNRINSIVRGIQHDAVHAETRQQLEESVCENLVQFDPFQFAWIGTVDETDHLTPRVWAGSDVGYLDDLFSHENISERADRFPAMHAVQALEPVTVHHLRSKVGEYPWACDALDRGFQSVMALPLTFKNSVYGVVEVYTSQAQDFTEDGKDVLREVCDFVANSINALERKQALATGSDTEIELRVNEFDGELFRLARRADSTLALQSVFPQPTGSWILHVTVRDGDIAALQDFGEQSVSIESLNPLDGEENGIELVVSEFSVATMLAEHGATLHSFVIRPDDSELVVHLPQTTDVRSFVDACNESFLSVELTRRSQITEDAAGADTPSLALDQLTERQQEVLEIAYQNGFFDWPRENTGEEIAESLNVSPPTFHRHIRRGTHELLRSLFD